MNNKPEWLKVKARSTEQMNDVHNMLTKLSLHTVCEEANCPNVLECFSRKTATFMILGNQCTRNCTFCNVSKGKTAPVDASEPDSVAKAASELGLRHLVVTSVTRDDLGDGGAGHFAEVIKKVREMNKSIAIEVLIPDFQGNIEALLKVTEAQPTIINHNIETVPRLYPQVRPMASYEQSLKLLENVKILNKDINTKSGIMVGLGEKEQEVIEIFKDLRNVDCDFLTVGQYLAPSAKHHPIIEYVHPDVFEYYRRVAVELGFKYVASAPLVRSSYLADKALGQSDGMGNCC